jgi:hypothetical protein
MHPRETAARIGPRSFALTNHSPETAQMNRMALLILFTITMLAALPLFAGDGSISLSPAVVQLTGSFGQTTTQPLTISNGTPSQLVFEMIAEDVVTRDGKRAFVPAGESAGSIAATAVFSRHDITVAPAMSETVNVTLTIPPGATERAVAVIFRGTTKVAHGSVGVVASIGTLLTFSVSGDVNVVTEPMEVRAQTTSGNLRLAQWCVNRGSEPVVARAVGAIIDSHGTLAGKVVFEAQRYLPGERLEMSGEFGGELSPGLYSVLITYDLEGKKSFSTSSTTVVQ